MMQSLDLVDGDSLKYYHTIFVNEGDVYFKSLKKFSHKIIFKLQIIIHQIRIGKRVTGLEHMLKKILDLLINDKVDEYSVMFKH